MFVLGYVASLGGSESKSDSSNFDFSDAKGSGLKNTNTKPNA